MIEVISVGSVVMLPQIKKIFVYLKPRKKEYWGNPCAEILLGAPVTMMDYHHTMDYAYTNIDTDKTFINEYYGRFNDELRKIALDSGVKIHLPSKENIINELRY